MFFVKNSGENSVFFSPLSEVSKVLAYVFHFMLKLYCMRDAVFNTHTVININPWSVLLYLGVTSAAFSDKKSKY